MYGLRLDVFAAVVTEVAKGVFAAIVGMVIDPVVKEIQVATTIVEVPVGMVELRRA